MTRVDSYPTRIYKGVKLREGRSLPFGATLVPGGVNFSVFSRHATSCELLLYHSGEDDPYLVIPFPDEFRIGSVFSMIVFDLDYENIEYGYRVDGRFAPEKGDRFDKTKVLLDPYAKAISGRNVWGIPPDYRRQFVHRGRIIPDDFDWEGDRPLEYPLEDLIIYEAHVRSYTKHPTSEVRHAGTFAGLTEKIPYLKDLGINCIELLPIFAFDEFENSGPSKITGEMLYNCWGYSTVGFFAPKAGYAATGRFGMEVDELKNLIKLMHKSGIEVILDVVFNHTAEGNENGPYISFRGLDNRTYYLLTSDGYYYNFSGCGNTFNCNNSIVRNMILECLRYWVSEYHIDGFRFDLASILSRDQQGTPMENPPLLETLAHDPILAKTKLIAEAWDAGGLYQVGSFPSWGRWAEWNGKFRDDIRRFLKGECISIYNIIDRLSGSPDMYHDRSANVSINFITCHDGFTLHDLVSYNYKHNEANNEDNRDGSNDNFSWNCGWEGPTNDQAILTLRQRQMKNAIAMLLMSRGVPLLLAGDEFANTQYGNNNAYCQDNETFWLNWTDKKNNSSVYQFFQKMILFRKSHPVLRNPNYNDNDSFLMGYPEFSWHQQRPWQIDSTSSSLTLAALFVESVRKYQNAVSEDTFIYFVMNMHWETHGFQLPQIPPGFRWQVVANTSWEDSFPDRPQALKTQSEVIVNARSVMILMSAKQK